MKVPYLNLNRSYSQITPSLTKAFKKVLKSGIVIHGKELKDFEKIYADFSKSKYAIGVGNGLDALTIALSALGISKGDEVIVPSNTYIATLIAVSRVGAKPILVEPKIDTYNIDPKKIEQAITKRTKAILPVHLFGQAAEMDEILKIAKKHKLFVVEDNAQSHGTKYKGKITGSFGDVNATSFYPGKNLGALGDAGAITTNNIKYFKNAVLLRNYGEIKKYYNEIIGYNSRLDELQAAFLKIRLKNLNKNNGKKIETAKFYLKKLKGVGDLILPITEEGSTHVYHIFSIRTKHRDKLQEFLSKKKITTLIHYPITPHLQKAYSHLNFKKGKFPIAEELADTSLSLPIFPEITKNELNYVVDSIKEYFKKYAKK